MTKVYDVVLLCLYEDSSCVLGCEVALWGSVGVINYLCSGHVNPCEYNVVYGPNQLFEL